MIKRDLSLEETEHGTTSELLDHVRHQLGRIQFKCVLLERKLDSISIGEGAEMGRVLSYVNDVLTDIRNRPVEPDLRRGRLVCRAMLGRRSA